MVTFYIVMTILGFVNGAIIALLPAGPKNI